MLGDDYYMGDVKRAVNEFAEMIDQKPEFLTNSKDNRYQIYNFVKK